MKKNALSFGLRTPAYRKADWPNFPEYAAVGRWESEFYDPQAWRAGHGFRPFLDLTRAGRARAAIRLEPNARRDVSWYCGQLGDRIASSETASVSSIGGHPEAQG